MRSYRTLPEIVTGYPLDDVWSIVVPIARTNLIINPSFETNTTSWTAIGGSIARSTTQQYHGAYSLAVTPTATTTDGARYDTVSLTSGQTYAYSAKVRGVAGLKYKLAIETTGAVELNSVTFTATGRWQWVVGYYTETSTTTRRLTARKTGHASVAIFYLDGVQAEAINAGETASTYLDGDQSGLIPNQFPAAFVWNGTPHASTSTRSGQTRAGGMVIPFKKYGFLLTAIIGLGLAGVQNVSTDYARIDGAYDDYTRKPPRQFTLTGRFQGRTYAELRRNRSGLAQLFDRDLTGQDQRMTLLRHVEDQNGKIVSSTTRALVKYESGLGGNTDNMHAETVPITFTQYLPGVLSDAESGASLTVQNSVASANDIIKRSPDGAYSVLGAGAAAAAFAFREIAVALDGKVYVTGLAVNIGGVAAADGVGFWDGTAWNAMTTGLAGEGHSIAFDAATNVYISGSFTSAGGVANTANLAKWNGSAWSSITPAGSANGIVTSLAFDSLGNLYAGGTFTTINAVAAAGIAKMTPAGTWTAMSTGLASSVNAIAISGGDTIYAGGAFTIGAINNVARWTGSAWAAMGTGLDSTVRKLTIGPNFLIYAAGDFTSGASAFNGITWTTLGSGLAGGVAVDVEVLPNNLVVFGGEFTSAGGITLPDQFAFWSGGSWTLPDVALPGTGRVTALAQSIDGSLYIGFETNGTATTPGVTTITNPGTARSYPTLTIKGPSSGTARIWQLLNVTTNRTIYFNYTINAGETARLVLTPDNLSFTSDFQGDIAGKIQPGSNTADFFLQPGANSISFFSADGTVTATIQWRPAYAGMDDVP